MRAFLDQLRNVRKDLLHAVLLIASPLSNHIHNPQPRTVRVRSVQQAVPEPAVTSALRCWTNSDTKRRFAGNAVQRRRGVPVRLLFQLPVVRRQRVSAPSVPRHAVLPGLPRHDSSLCKCVPTTCRLSSSQSRPRHYIDILENCVIKTSTTFTARQVLSA